MRIKKRLLLVFLSLSVTIPLLGNTLDFPVVGCKIVAPPMFNWTAIGGGYVDVEHEAAISYSAIRPIAFANVSKKDVIYIDDKFLITRMVPQFAPNVLQISLVVHRGEFDITLVYTANNQDEKLSLLIIESFKGYWLTTPHLAEHLAQFKPTVNTKLSGFLSITNIFATFESYEVNNTPVKIIEVGKVSRKSNFADLRSFTEYMQVRSNGNWRVLDSKFARGSYRVHLSMKDGRNVVYSFIRFWQDASDYYFARIESADTEVFRNGEELLKKYVINYED